MLYRGCKIGVFFKTKLWAEQWMNDFLNMIDHSCILRFVRNGVHPFMIELKDGTQITAYQATDNARGTVIDKAFVEPSIDETIIRNVIRPLLGHSQSIVVEFE